MRFDCITTLPEVVEAYASASVLGRACDKGIIEINAVNLRDYTEDKHKTTDDEPYGGGPGMVMKCEPVFRAVESLAGMEARARPKVVLMTPQGRTFNQDIARQYAREPWIIMICGRYEGVDERIRESLVDDEISIGDYVITGGEIAAMIVFDAVARLVPGVLGDETSAESESFISGLLEYGHYTRPYDFRGMKVPEVLTSGNHKEIEKWRRRESLRRTFLRRPDLIEKTELTEEDKRILREFETRRIEED